MKQRVSLLVASYDTQGLRWAYSISPEPTRGPALIIDDLGIFLRLYRFFSKLL